MALASWGDYDGDGDLDLHVANYGQVDSLYRNDAGGHDAGGGDDDDDGVE